MRRNLVLARVGPSSLHGHWLAGAADRSWDLRLVPYAPLPADALDGCETEPVVVGPKWTGLREVLTRWDGWREYDYIWLPDDDIATSAGTINRMFEVAATVGLDLFQPALDERSYFAHFDTVRNPAFFGRWVGFVEIMVPGFSRSALERLLPTLAETDTGWGWGLDSVWPKLLDYRNVAILDAVPVNHARPVGVMRDAELARRVREESDRLLAAYRCGQVHATFGAFDADGTALRLDPSQLLARLISGAAPLIERDPRILGWIMEFQRPHFSWPAYPIAGTPAGPALPPPEEPEAMGAVPPAHAG